MMNNDELGYLGNPLVKRSGVTQSFTEKEISEYIKCRADPAYFAKHYVKVIHLDRGLVPFDLYPYQETMFKHFSENRFSIVLACRQSGKSISVLMYILWYAIFHENKTVVVLANKGSTARELMARITLALENLPFFLQPGCKTLNKGSIAWDNNTKIIASATSASSCRGISANLILLDEFAFVQNASEFYTSTYPVISSGKDTKVIITSTANGVGNQFYRIWEGAVTKRNEYKPFRVDWWDVPGRDEKWKLQTIANTSELQFAQEFGNSFIATSTTLVTSDLLLSLSSSPPIFAKNGIFVYEEPIEDHKYVMTVDVSKGRGQDYSTFTIIDITKTPYRQVAVFRSNTLSPLLFPDIIVKYGTKYNDAIVIIENNDAGQVVCNGVYYELEYENTFVESPGVGVTMTKKVKRIGCSNLKDLLEMKKLEIVDGETIGELATFQLKGSSYEAEDGNHDDLIMNLVLFAWFVSTDAFSDNGDISLKELLFSDREKMIMDDLSPPGFFSSSSEVNPEYERLKESAILFSKL